MKKHLLIYPNFMTDLHAFSPWQEEAENRASVKVAFILALTLYYRAGFFSG